MDNKQQIPSVGRMVHYFAYGTPGGEFPASVARAAVITEVDTPGDPFSAVGLCVMNPSGLFFNPHVPYMDEGPLAGHWGWPVYVGPLSPRAQEPGEGRILPK